MALDSLLLILALGRTTALLLNNLRDKPSPLERLLLRDSIFACLATLSVAIVNLEMWRVPGHSLIYAFPAVAQAVESVVACRLILNIRGFANPMCGQLSLDGDVLRIHSPGDLEDIQLTTMPG
ncbi:hypothetical protein PsYK624_049320 [Phanerochaete sordida]|uniref:Uncharacterized protein n=1 Tax=Phanerochaete sordida TaxID=48140 RepID=A0A9P3G7C3_9APHY|nr:hypothetical protein PsYK624_049320 [Phanerochaete sordida]